jgi:Family of unknown function (DUF5681)
VRRRVTTYEVGYGRPPIHTRFKKGMCPNPNGRGKRDPTEMANIIRKALSQEVEYREGRRVRRGLRWKIIRKLFSEAMRGDVSSAAALLKMREHVETHGDIGPVAIKFGLPASLATNL